MSKNSKPTGVTVRRLKFVSRADLFDYIHSLSITNLSPRPRSPSAKSKSADAETGFLMALSASGHGDNELVGNKLREMSDYFLQTGEYSPSSTPEAIN